MHLVSMRPQTMTLRAADVRVELATGERILTEISRKFTRSTAACWSEATCGWPNGSRTTAECSRSASLAAPEGTAFSRYAPTVPVALAANRNRSGKQRRSRHRRRRRCNRTRRRQSWARSNWSTRTLGRPRTRRPPVSIRHRRRTRTSRTGSWKVPCRDSTRCAVRVSAFEPERDRRHGGGAVRRRRELFAGAPSENHRRAHGEQLGSADSTTRAGARSLRGGLV
jgi:hypothetical protein